MAADDGKKSPGADPGLIIDPDSFWDEQAGEEEVTAPHQPIPTPAAQRPAGARQPPPQVDDPDLAVVGPADLFQGQQTTPPGRPQRPPRPVSKPGPPPQVRPAPATGRPAPAARRPAPAPTQPARPRPRPATPAEPAVEIEGEAASPARIVLALVAVIVLCGFLGWFLIGRHAGPDLTPPETPFPEGADVPAPADPLPEKAVQPTEAAAAAKPVGQDSKHTVTMQVSSEPPGAQVFVDDEHRGVTPATVRGLPTVGQARLKIMLEGHKPWEQTIALDAEDLEREVRAGLVKLTDCKAGTGFLYITTRPAGATIELDGKRLPGRTPKVLNDLCAVVPHKLKLEKAGFSPWRSEVRIKPDDIHNLEVKLER